MSNGSQRVAGSRDYPRVDLQEVARTLGLSSLDNALAALRTLYADVDAHNVRNTRALDLPCHRGCDACCHESVFLTPLEFFAAWDYVQTQLTDGERNEIVSRGLDLYRRHESLITALNAPIPEGDTDHFRLARDLKFTCPLLDLGQGACMVYPVRELYARLFGCSFNPQGGIYGCHLVGAHLAGKQVTLLPVRGTARRLADLPLTDMRQVYPFYIHALYGTLADR